MGELDTPRITYILNRGAYDKHGEVVKPAALSAVLPFDTTRFQRNRLGLAQWTVTKENPIIPAIIGFVIVFILAYWLIGILFFSKNEMPERLNNRPITLLRSPAYAS
jgi:hypothetical protein